LPAAADWSARRWRFRSAVSGMPAELARLRRWREALFVANCVPEWPASFERGPKQLFR
jgi:hypothetical protein